MVVVIKHSFELDVWIANGEGNLEAFLELLDSYGYVVFHYKVIIQRVNDARYSFIITHYGSDDLKELEWLGDFYQVKNQFSLEVDV